MSIEYIMEPNEIFEHFNSSICINVWKSAYAIPNHAIE